MGKSSQSINLNRQPELDALAEQNSIKQISPTSGKHTSVTIVIKIMTQKLRAKLKAEQEALK